MVLALASLYPHYLTFLVVRLLQGVVCGVFSAIIPLIIRENSPPEMTNLTGAFANLFIITGLFLLYLIGFLLGVFTLDFSGASFWKTIFLLPIFGVVVQTILLIRFYNF